MMSYKKYMLVVLTAILVSNYLDRLALGLVLQSIKDDLALNDTQLGLLTGMAFAVFYSIMGIPIARWADRGNRVVIISSAATLWSAAVAFCAVASTFTQLVLIRVAVAVGEAGCVPPAHSLIAEYFTRAERPRAVAFYKLGVPVSALLGFFLAGWLNQFYGWRATFLVLSVPGLLLGAVARWTLREPRSTALKTPPEKLLTRRPSSGKPSLSAPKTLQFSSCCLALWRITTFRYLLLGFSISFFFGYGVRLWEPTFFVRTYGLQTGELGTWLAVIVGIGGIVGVYLGGELASRFAANNERLQLKAAAILYCCFGVTSAGIYLSPNPYLAFALLAVGTVGGSLAIGPLFATIQTLVPDNMRAMSIAVFYLFANLIGMGLGPLTVGMLSDWLHPWLGEDALRYALLTLSPGYIWAGWYIWRGSTTVEKDIAERGTARVDPDENSDGVISVKAQ